MRLTHDKKEALRAGTRFLGRFCKPGHFVEVRRGIVRCLRPEISLVVEVNFRLPLGDASFVLPWGPKTPRILKTLGYGNTGCFLTATKDATLVADTVAKFRLPLRTADTTARHIPAFEIGNRLGVDFANPDFSVLVCSRLKKIARQITKGKLDPDIDFFARHGELEAEIVLPYRGAAIDTTTISTILEPAAVPVSPCDIEFMVKAKHVCKVPVNSVLTAYYTKDANTIAWVISGVAHRNPVVTFKVIGVSVDCSSEEKSPNDEGSDNGDRRPVVGVPMREKTNGVENR